MGLNAFVRPPGDRGADGRIRATRLDIAPCCELAWNKDPVFGVIGIQSGPRG